MQSTNVSAVQEKKKFSFKMPHLLWIMLGLILLMSLLTYVIPAGAFAKDDKGTLIGTAFSYIGHQTPVTPWRAAMLMLDGLTGSGLIIFVVMVSGASIGVILDTGAVDDFLNWAVFKLSTKGTNILIPMMFVMMTYLGAFGGSDALIAVVPIGVLFAKKLKLDPIVAIGVTTFATLIGFGTGPTKQMITQAMMGVPVYSGFGVRFISMNFFMLVGLFMLMRYVNKIRKDAAKSALGSADWQNDLVVDGSVEIKEGKLTWQTLLIMLIFFGQYIVIVWFSFINAADAYKFMIAVYIIAAILCGVISGMSGDELGNSFAKGLATMAFVGFVIGMARVVSLVMTEGQIIHTIVYTLTRPLMNLNKGLSAIGMTAVISVINVLIPSATSKAAILVPIIQPVAQALNLTPQIAVQAFQYGDGFTNLISPALGWTIGSCAMAKVPFDKWFKWVFPKVVILSVMSYVWIYVLNQMGWTGM